MTDLEALQSLFSWARKEDFRGNDPHDLLESHVLPVRGDGGGAASKMLRIGVLQAGRRLPLNLRTLLRVPKMENAKGIALFLSGLLRAQENVCDDWLGVADGLAQRLLKSQSENGGWGYPFAWQSRTHYLKAGTPTVVTTAFAGFALIDYFALTGKPEIMKAIESAANYVLTELRRTESVDGLAFGYAKDDPQIVFNASLLAAELLARVDAFHGYHDYDDLLRRAALFVIHHQRADGSWAYGLEANQTWVDSFHTGFVVLSLKEIGDRLHDEAILNAARCGFEYFRTTFIEQGGAVRYFPNDRYPIDAHALGQAIVTLVEFGDVMAAQCVAMWARENMRDTKGYYYYQKHAWGLNKIPYMRWSNAWMFRGLAELSAATKSTVPQSR